MRSSLVKFFQVAPAAFGAVVAFGSVASAQAIPGSDAVNPTLQRSEQYYVGPSMMNQAQVTSVSEFVDVKPTDWAFLALQSLVERYGCIVGLPTNPPTYQGRRATTRFEFAAGLNACLDRINELIAAAVEPLATKEDLLVLQRLQEEFAAELSIIRGRVDALEARTALLEQQQFSTTTKLRGEVIFQAYGVSGGDNAYDRLELGALKGNRAFTGAGVAAPGAVGATAGSLPGNPNRLIGQKNDNRDKLAMGYRVRLNFDTSFTGNDLLRVRLQAGDIANLAAQSTGANESRLSTDIGTAGAFQIDSLFYNFTFDRGRGRIMIAGANVENNDYFDTYNPFASDSQGSISRFGRFNPLFYRSGANTGTGAFVGYQFNPIFRVDAGYLAVNPGTGASAANPDLGLFGSNYTASLLLGIEPLRNFKFGIGYTHSYNENITGPGGTPASGISLAGATGTTFANNPFVPGIFAAPSVGRQYAKLDSINVMFQWRALPIFTLAGWVGYGWVRGEADTLPGLASGTNPPAGTQQGPRRANILTAALAFAFPDVFGRRGDLAGLIVGIPPYVTGSEWNGGSNAAGFVAGNNVPGGVANGPFATQGPRRLNLRDTSVPIHLEALYRFQVNKFITVTPGAFAVFNPEGNNNNPPFVVYTIRTTFTF